MARQAGGQDAVEQVDAVLDGHEEVIRRAHAHEIARSRVVSQGLGHGASARAMSAFDSPTDRPPTAIPSNARLAMARVEAVRNAGSVPPWMIPNTAWSARDRAASDRSAQRWVRAMASSTACGGASAPTRWSRTMATSLPSASWMAIARSGVRRIGVPSRCEAKVTPSSSTVRSRPRLKTWKPPESVRIGPSQAMKACRPPRRAIRSSPGRKVRW